MPNTKRMQALKKSTQETFFSPISLIERCAAIIEEQCGKYEVFVDSSCGNGYTGLLMHGKYEKKVFMFDIDLSHLIDDAKECLKETCKKDIKIWQMDFNSVDDRYFNSATGCDSVVIGFNPPYGHRGKQAKEMLQKASTLFQKFASVYIAMLLPFIKGDKGEYLPPGFALHYELSLQDQVFFLPNGDHIKKSVKLIIFKRNRALHIEQKKAQFIDKQIELPRGWGLQTLNKAIANKSDFKVTDENGKFCNRYNIPLSECKLIPGKTFVMNISGPLSGKYYYFKGEDGQYKKWCGVQSNKLGITKIVPDTKGLPMQCYFHVTYPNKFTNGDDFLLYTLFRKIMEKRAEDKAKTVKVSWSLLEAIKALSEILS